MSLWEDVKSNLVELYTTTSEKTSEIARVTTRKYDKFGISRDIERQFSELGNLVYTGLKEGREDILTDPAIEALRQRIDALESELTDKDEEIDAIREEYADRKAQAKAAAATAGAQTVTETVITDPVLESGHEESAILVEPAEVETAEKAPEVDIEVEIQVSETVSEPAVEVETETAESGQDDEIQAPVDDEALAEEKDPDKEKP